MPSWVPENFKHSLCMVFKVLATQGQLHSVICRITSAPLQDIKSEKQVADDDVKALLASSLKSKKKNKKKKAPKAENGVTQPQAEE